MTEPAALAPKATWRVPARLRLGSIPVWVLAALFVFGLINPHGRASTAVASVVALASGVLPYAVFFRPGIDLYESTVVVRNPFSTTTVELVQVKRFELTSRGLKITVKSGQSTTAWAIQKSGKERRQQLRTAGDDVQLRLEEAVSEAVSSAVGPVQPSPE